MTTTTHHTHWSLEDLLPGGPEELETALTALEAGLQQVEAFRPRLSADLAVDEFLDLLQVHENLVEQAHILGAFAFLTYAEDTQNPAALSLRDRIDQILAEVENRALFVSLWIKSLSDDDAQRYVGAAGDLSYYIESLRRFKPFTLSEPEEKIINLKDVTGSEGLVRIYEILTNGFQFKLKVDGELKTLTRDGLTQYYRHPSADVRAATYQELYRVYGEYKNVLAQIYAFLVRDWYSEQVKLRGYTSPISVRNLSNDLPDAVVDTLLDACRQNTGLYQRYFQLKARALGMDRLRRYDIYAPLTRAEQTYDFDAAARLVLDSFEKFSARVGRAAARVLEQDHLDAEVRSGKRGGAFSYSVAPSLTPWVLVNFNGRIRDVTTLAHELGHAVHGILASKHSVLNFDAPLPLAETASVFGEMLVTDRLLETETDPAVQRDLLLTILDDSYATVQRQAYFSVFERTAHDRIAGGCTSEDLARDYLENLAEQFGEAVELSEEYAWEWTTIPHIYHSPFYTYAYSFGQLLVLALYQQYLNEGEPFVPRYLKLLSYGGSAAPMTILSEAGLDVVSPAFWQGGFDVLRSRVDHLEKIIGGSK